MDTIMLHFADEEAEDEEPNLFVPATQLTCGRNMLKTLEIFFGLFAFQNSLRYVGLSLDVLINSYLYMR